MNQDERCCGTGTCLISAEGLCWCDQQWNGIAMCRPAASKRLDTSAPPAQQTPKSSAAQGDTP